MRRAPAPQRSAKDDKMDIVLCLSVCLSVFNDDPYELLTFIFSAQFVGLYRDAIKHFVQLEKRSVDVCGLSLAFCAMTVLIFNKSHDLF